MTATEAFKKSTSPTQLKQAFIVMMVVGTCLNLINQGDVIWAGASLNVPKLLLTYLVPFLVATYGAWSALYQAED